MKAQAIKHRSRLQSLAVTKQFGALSILQKHKKSKEKRGCWSELVQSSKTQSFTSKQKKKIWDDQVEWNHSFITNFGLIESGTKRILAPYAMDPSKWPSTNFKWNGLPHNPSFLYHFHLHLNDFWLYSRFFLEKKTSKFLHPILIKTAAKWKICMEHCLKDR